MQELTKAELDKVRERLLPGERILWQGKPCSGWKSRVAKEWKGIFFLLFFAMAFGRGFYVVAAGNPSWNGEVVFSLAVMGVCSLAALGTVGALVLNAILESRKLNAFIYAMTDRRLLSIGPSADGRGTFFQQFDGASLRKIRMVPHHDGTGDLVFRYQFPPGKKPVPQGWLALPYAERVVERIRGIFPGVAASRLR